MAQRKWFGVMTKDLRSLGNGLAGKEADFKKGDKVIVYKRRTYEKDHHGKTMWRGGYEFHYSMQDGSEGFCRSSEFLIEETEKPKKE